MLFLKKTPDLSELDHQIYNYIRKNSEQVTYMRIRELAEKIPVSVASIQRFCQKFECSGFSEFKIRLRIYLENEEQVQNILPIDTSVYTDFFDQITKPSFQNKVEKAIKLLREKEMILFIGVGSSNILAEYGALYFSSLFKMALRIEDPVTNPIAYLSKELLDKSCVIALSVSGETPEIINYLSNFNFRDSAIISITNSSNSTVAKLSDVNLTYYITKESILEQDVTSQLPTLFLIEYLAKSIHSTSQNILK